MNKILSWDDIPSVDGLEIDWDYKPKTSLDKRAFVRLDHNDIAGLFEEKVIFVKVSTVKKLYTGQLLDLSEGGLLLGLPDRLDKNLPLKVGFIIGKFKVITKAVVKHTCKSEECYTTGIMFVDLDKKSREYIAGLYASKVLYLAS